MRKQQLDYQGVTRSERPTSQVSFQKIVSCSLLGLGILTALVALVWPHRRWELLGAAISLGATGLVVLLPFRRM
jgi:hypothetical protein